MKEYPSIGHVLGYHGRPCIAFYKYDGSNLRFCWNRKSGWNKQGTRTRLFDKTDPVFGEAIDIFQNTLADDLVKIFKSDKQKRNAQSVIVFCEFFGDKSFAGQHHDNDPKKLVLFDVNPHKQGILGPNDFVDKFGFLGNRAAQVVYQGTLTKTFETEVRENVSGLLNEGVICKGGGNSPHQLWMAKIKTNQYLQKLKDTYADGWQKYWE